MDPDGGDEIPRELFQRKPASKEWSAHEGLQHIVDSERMVFPLRIGYLLRGEDFPAFDPDAEGMNPVGMSVPGELAREKESLALLSKVGTGDGGLSLGS